MPKLRDPDSAAESASQAEAATLRRPDELLALARAAAAHDPIAASTLVLQVAGSILGTVRQVLGGGHPDTEDVAQEAVIAFLGSLTQFRGDCSTQSYAQRVALFTALAARRRMVARNRLIDAEQSADVLPAPLHASPHAEALSAERREIVAKVLDSLPDVIAEALALHFILGYTVDEIAEACSSPPNTVWSRLRLGKQALRRAVRRSPRLNELFGEEE